jgi:hypothetical protein
MRYHYIREAITKHDMILKHIFTNSMVTDPLIKPKQGMHLLNM